jgi:hypothetical protein
LPTFAGFRKTGVVMLTSTIRITRIRSGPALNTRRAREITDAPIPRSPLRACNATADRSSTRSPLVFLIDKEHKSPKVKLFLLGKNTHQVHLLRIVKMVATFEKAFSDTGDRG